MDDLKMKSLPPLLSTMHAVFSLLVSVLLDCKR